MAVGLGLYKFKSFRKRQTMRNAIGSSLELDSFPTVAITPGKRLDGYEVVSGDDGMECDTSSAQSSNVTPGTSVKVKVKVY